jgi:non-canonical purine NTP pyrophosphatase (RdgB/HAM1 family)
MEIYFVTGNKDKIREAEQVLERQVNSIKLDIPEIQALHVKDVVEDKARKAYEQVKKPVMVEDTGLYFTSLNGFPGALIKWLLDSIKNEGICKLLADIADRSAYAETSVCFYDGTACKTFSGRIYGRIVESPRGTNGFGWDAIFQPDGSSKTFAEMNAEEKNAISMRKEAFAQLKQYLQETK